MGCSARWGAAFEATTRADKHTTANYQQKFKISQTCQALHKFVEIATGQIATLIVHLQISFCRLDFARSCRL